MLAAVLARSERSGQLASIHMSFMPVRFITAKKPNLMRGHFNMGCFLWLLFWADFSVIFEQGLIKLEDH